MDESFKPTEQEIHSLFKIGIWTKGIIALLEIVAGLVAFGVPLSFIEQIATLVTADALLENPNDFLASHVLSWALGLSAGTKLFVGMYLLGHGVLKMLVIVGLLREKRWAFPTALFVFGSFIFYQIYRYFYTHAWSLIALSLLDALVMWFIWREYQLRFRAPVRSETRA